MLTFSDRLLRRVSALEKAHLALVLNLQNGLGPTQTESQRRGIIESMLAREAEQIAGLKMDLGAVQLLAGPCPAFLPPLSDAPTIAAPAAA